MRSSASSALALAQCPPSDARQVAPARNMNTRAARLPAVQLTTARVHDDAVHGTGSPARAAAVPSFYCTYSSKLMLSLPSLEYNACKWQHRSPSGQVSVHIMVCTLSKHRPCADRLLTHAETLIRLPCSRVCTCERL